jgi:hypothetical protein
VFLLNRRFIFGPDARSLFVTMFLIVASVQIFCPFVANKLMDKFSYALGLLVMIVAALFSPYVSIVLSIFQITTFIYLLRCALQVLLLNNARNYWNNMSFNIFKRCVYCEFSHLGVFLCTGSFFSSCYVSQ